MNSTLHSRQSRPNSAWRFIRDLVAATGLAVVVAGPAFAGPELLTNGGFETGTFAGWTATGDQTFNGVQCPGPGSTVFAGNCSAFFGPVGSLGGISQTVILSVGEFYRITFAFEPDGGTPSFFSALFGGVPLVSVTNPAASGYQSFSFLVQATSTNESLAFNFRDDPGFLFLDAVSVRSVPEPATLALLALGLAGIGFSRRKQ